MDAAATDQQDLIGDFTDEAIHALQGLPGLLESFRMQPDDTGPINAAFRDIHSMKGCSAFLGLNTINASAHLLENALDAIRGGRLPLGEELEAALVDGFDLLDLLVQEVLDGQQSETLSDEQQEVLRRVETLVGTSGGEPSPEDVLLEEIKGLAEEMASCEMPEALTWAQRMEGSVHRYMVGEEGQQSRESEAAENAAGTTPSDYVDSMFTCMKEDVTSQVKSLLGMFIAHDEGRLDKSLISSFLDNCKTFGAWTEEAGEAGIAEQLYGAATDFQTMVDGPIELDENLLSIIWERLRPVLEKLKVSGSTQAAELENANRVADKPAVEDREESSSTEKRAKFVRVKEDRLEDFAEHVSRLSITTEALRELQSRMATGGQHARLAGEMQQLNRDLREQTATLQQDVMALRRVAVGGLFAKFPRMARTLASNLGKKINVHVSGEDTPIDKNLAEELDAPLTHLIRNVVDHGIETSQERRARGVSEAGNLWLKAQQGQDHVRIIVQDDGRGIDPQKLRSKAMETGVLTRSQAEGLSDSEAVDLIFHPGLSTADTVSDVSGRGVGMDAVRATVEQHNGEVTVESKLNVGTTICLKIPIRQSTLVIDGLTVEQCGQQFVIPYEHIARIAELPGHRFGSAGGRRLLSFRKQAYDAPSLGEVLGLGASKIEPHEAQSAVLLECKQGDLCLLVDRVLGARQVVVTSLRHVLPGCGNFSGVAHLGSGCLVLVLDVPEIIKRLQRG